MKASTAERALESAGYPSTVIVRQPFPKVYRPGSEARRRMHPHLSKDLLLIQMSKRGKCRAFGRRYGVDVTNFIFSRCCLMIYILKRGDEGFLVLRGSRRNHGGQASSGLMASFKESNCEQMFAGAEREQQAQNQEQMQMLSRTLKLSTPDHKKQSLVINIRGAVRWSAEPPCTEQVATDSRRQRLG